MNTDWNVARVLCPCDFSPSSRAALATATSIARRFDAELVLVHVIEPLLFPVEYGLVTAPPFDLEEQAAGNARRELDTLLSTIGKGLKSARAEVLFGLPWQQILDCQQQTRADLVVIGTHGHTGLKHLLLGSTAERVVRHASVPVLTVKGCDAAAQREGRPGETPN
jgi:universal stress protein A